MSKICPGKQVGESSEFVVGPKKWRESREPFWVDVDTPRMISNAWCNLSLWDLWLGFFKHDFGLAKNFGIGMDTTFGRLPKSLKYVPKK